MTPGGSREKMQGRRTRFVASQKREADVPRRRRINLALVLMAIAIVLNLILLFGGETSPGWPLAAVILLGAAGAALLAQPREY